MEQDNNLRLGVAQILSNALPQLQSQQNLLPYHAVAEHEQRWAQYVDTQTWGLSTTDSSTGYIEQRVSCLLG